MLAQLYAASPSDVRKSVEITLDVLESDEGVQLLEDGGDTNFVGIGQVQECVHANAPGAPGERSDPSERALQVPVRGQMAGDTLCVAYGDVVPQ